jgi:hypothetical protein
MTDYNGLIQSVYVETGRPDLVNETAAAVKQAVVGLHARGRYLKDIMRARVVFDYPSFIQELEIVGLPLYRNIAYAKVGSGQNLTVNGLFQPIPVVPAVPPLFGFPWGYWNFPEFDIIQADDILNVNGFEKRNVAYQAGKSIYLRGSWEFQYLQLGYFAYPNTDISNNASNFDSWIADEYPYAVTLMAAGNVYQKKGQNDLAAVINNTVPNSPAGIQYWFDMIDRNNIAA